MFLEISVFMVMVILLLRFSSKWLTLFRKDSDERHQKALAQSLDWDRKVENRRLRKQSNPIIKFWRG